MKSSKTSENEAQPGEKLPICGIIMPIAKTDGYPDQHWNDVYSILCESAASTGFNANLVSFDDDTGIIHKRIIHNLYSNPIVICDVSSRNANVMLELGMRLAFDKPTIIVKDEKTPYSFDIAAIEHLEYPSDLRYQSINEFKEKLKVKIKETYRRAEEDSSFTTFLKHFGTFKVAKIDEKEVSRDELITGEIRELKTLLITSLSNNQLALGDRNKKSQISNELRRVYTSSVKLDKNKNIDIEALSKMLNLQGANLISIQKSLDGDEVSITYDLSVSSNNLMIMKWISHYIKDL